MEFSEIQISLTALFLFTAVAIVVFCNILRNKAHARQNRPQVNEVELTWQPFEARVEEPVTASLASEIAALARLGMQEENATWRRISPVTEPPVAQPQPVAPASKALLPPVTMDEFLFDTLVSGRSTKNFSAPNEIALVPTVQAHYEVIQPANIPTPQGLIDEVTLRRILSIGKPFTGVVAVIAVNDQESDRRSESQREFVCSFIAGLLDEHEFACRTGREEFLLVCPGVLGGEGQRRLNEIAERLWEFQLRGIGTRAIKFSWGGVEVYNQPLAEAIASAAERMHQTQRVRNPILFDSVNARRKFV